MSTKIPTKKPLGSSKSISMSASVGHMPTTSVKVVRESNYTPSITNIGSNVLRSKTADFERILDHNKKSRISTVTATVPTPQLQSSNANDHQQSFNVINQNLVALKTTSTSRKKPNDDSSEKRNSIYKRQELISSVQRSMKK